ncbi:hypothetical protein N7492_004558 [Penicillium capsulatum]|uniref:RNA recognition motif-containing protein n=1 Tax=Penicillium capsulatum TaxID=69766 RepID=A0A9W9IAP2_9EURO|nr:hypothetical protein N7492_004558 [Penicillium capsulatum]KAJ6136324.1 hypothetical protein N7512_001484 [Penicillium capsulatum]
MPPRPGEETLLTVFADIHYYFNAPTPKPSHHRFDKGSYVYIHHDAIQNKARIEIANNPGTPDQDAFHGGLSNVHIQHSTQFPTLCTLTVDGLASSPQQDSQYEWRLPSGDRRDDQHDLLRLHTLDIYFWTQEDSTDFLDSISRVITSAQLETDRAATGGQVDQPMSSVVQQLENVAVSDPAYQNGQTPNSQAAPVAVAAPAAQAPPQAPSFPPPPSSGPPAEHQQTHADRQAPAVETQEPASAAPLPYNPAAPAAPEPIKHREKTPPPEDGTEGTGLMAAAAADQGMPYTPPHQVAGGVGISAFAPPPTSTNGLSYPGISATAPTGYASPPPSAGLTHSNSFSTHKALQSPLQSPGPQSPGLPSYQQSFVTGQQWPQNTAGTMSFAPPPQDPNAHLYSHPQQHSQFSHHAGHSGSIGGQSNYSHDQPQVSQQPSSEYDVHSQVYRPTDAELNSHSQKYAQKAMKNPGERPRKLENNAARFESGVNRFFKKLEKKL